MNRLKKVKSSQCATLNYNKANSVQVESTFVRALPGFSIVGMANQSIQESKDRIKSALLSIDFKFPAQKITVSLSPSDLKKEGSHFDLVIALVIALQNEQATCEDFYVFGELGLDGKVKKTTTIFPIILSLASQNEKIKVVVPKDSLSKIRQIPNVESYGVETLSEAIAFFTNPTCRQAKDETIDFNFGKSIIINNQEYFYNPIFELDFKEIKGQARAKRAMLISAVGMHNILLEGSPGCGKSMSIKRLRHILPPMSIAEMLQSNAYKSLNEEDEELSSVRAFRSPHHTSSKPSIFGGGSSHAMAGECALAHNGILFFDEFPHFSKMILESLREPLEDHKVLISRVQSKVSYETKFLFAAAQNPCPCGNLLSNSHECRCSDLEIGRYKNRISEPLLDRIDMYLQMSEETSHEEGLGSNDMFEQVLKAFAFQKERGQESLNGKLSEEETAKYCLCDNQAKETLHVASARFGLSHRGINKTLRVARSIADLICEPTIKKEHILEALSFRRR
ncbi:MAG: YifB family Mg chelatase-like AAA ATPase [Sulfurospirillaceae bacterium]|nr:YifB family Mg chelatase-like AAA ATPase [Sulfurospirillaceae bacterium]